jgi:peptide/nickel transport system permease protein
MFGYIVRRIISGALVLLVVSVAVFALFFYGPADPALAYCPETRCTPTRLENIRSSLGLDRPVAEQYGEYMRDIATGGEFKLGAIGIDCPAPCLGVSFKLRVPVTEYLAERFKATLSIALGGAAIFLSVGLTLGILAA